MIIDREVTTDIPLSLAFSGPERSANAHKKLDQNCVIRLLKLAFGQKYSIGTFAFRTIIEPFLWIWLQSSTLVHRPRLPKYSPWFRLFKTVFVDIIVCILNYLWVTATRVNSDFRPVFDTFLRFRQKLYLLLFCRSRKNIKFSKKNKNKKF